MSYRTYIRVRQYKSKEEKEDVHAQAFRHIENYIETDDDGDTTFLINQWITEQLKPDVDRYQLGTTTIEEDLIHRNNGFIQNKIVENALEKYGKDVLHGVPSLDADGNRIVILNKEDIVELIKERFRLISKNYERKTKYADIAYEYLNSTAKEIYVEDLLEDLKRQANVWQQKSQNFKLLEDGTVRVPVSIAWSYEHEVWWLCNLINNYNWESIDIILYGY